ncbi:MAG: phosphatidylserine decarboxylase [Rhodospirillales bacterium]|nr:phosphatidylserine decarboxylase [Rhodospirillales bacterium]
MLKTVFVPINRAGWPFIAIFALVAAGLWYWHFAAGLVGCVLTLWCIYFFRDPDRFTPTREGLVICPADGVVQSVVRAVPPPELEMGDTPRTRIAVFMNVFDVHVNRVPIDGKITKVSYRPGKFFNASLDKASIDNERMSLKVTSDDGTEIGFVQIAGLVARRILCHAKVGDSYRAGERFGMIRFGSRVDVFLPDGIEPLVCVGQTTLAAETVLADLKSSEKARDGEIR